MSCQCNKCSFFNRVNGDILHVLIRLRNNAMLPVKKRSNAIGLVRKHNVKILKEHGRYFYIVRDSSWNIVNIDVVKRWYLSQQRVNRYSKKFTTFLYKDWCSFIHYSSSVNQIFGKSICYHTFFHLQEKGDKFFTTHGRYLFLR